jgi:ABC-2 type transport system ATP-binding protein
MNNGFIDVRRLSVSRGGRRILSDLSVSFDPGITAVLGPNGAGKTTLLNAIADLGRGSQGEIEIDGMLPKTSADVRRLYRTIGFMPQNWTFFSGYNARESVQYAAWLKGMATTKGSSAALKALADVNLSESALTKVRKLSGGMRQRVGLAEAIVADPLVTILDEPTVGLDPQQRMEFRSALRRRSGTSAVILSTHLTDDVSAMADRVLILDEGKFVFDGTVSQLESLAPSSEGEQTESDIERGYLHALRKAANA